MATAFLEFDLHPADRRPADRDTGFELGWDFAHHLLTPPIDHLTSGSPLRQGWEAGRASFGARTLEPTRHVRKWLQLRLNAWRRGRSFESVQVTPNYLRQIDAEHCPITRETLTHGTGQASDASIDRVRNDAGYAAGNLAVMSARANAAKGRCGFDEALASMRLAEAQPPGAAGALIDSALAGRHGNAATATAAATELGSLGAPEWARIAVLCAFVTALPHEQAAGLPLLVLPPNRLRLFNPIQALQALVTRQLDRPGWSARIASIVALIPGKAVRRDFQLFVHALLPRVLEAGSRADATTLRWALEDAWRNPLVLRCWTRFARQLSAVQAEQIVLRASKLRLGAQTARPFTHAEATEGWALERGGYLAVAPGTVVSIATAATAATAVTVRPPPPPRRLPTQLAFNA